MEVSKLRLQLGLYKNTLDSLKAFVRGPWQFYGHFVPQTLLHDCAHSATQWAIFEFARQHLFASRGEDELPASENLALGMGAGALTAVLTTPMDVLRTRIVGRLGNEPSGGLLATARRMWREEGLRAFKRGALLRVLSLAPSAGLYMVLYEAMKHGIADFRGFTSGGKS